MDEYKNHVFVSKIERWTFSCLSCLDNTAFLDDRTVGRAHYGHGRSQFYFRNGLKLVESSKVGQGGKHPGT